ncbi:MAG: aldolase/citrate lyase family protein [Acidobacteriota bacterium]|nr:aldolase/citrate lyase family protein [Acidobacteriota bacterium]
MNRTFSDETLGDVFTKLDAPNVEFRHSQSAICNPIHVVYGGANLFTPETVQKLGKIALKGLREFAPDFAEFGRAMWLKGADALPQFADVVADLEKYLEEDAEKVKAYDFDAWFAWTIYRRTIEKLEREPIEDFRIDFEDGYGFRTDEEEDAHCVSSSDALAESFLQNTITPFCGFRVKSFAPETLKRAIRTLDLFLTNLIEKTEGCLPENFVVTLPKITRASEVEVLDELLTKFEKRNNIESGTIKIEIMIETTQAIINESGGIALQSLVEAANGRCASAHFGAYDYTASLNISGAHQHLRHEACNFARQMMQIALSPLNIRLSDSVTTELPIPVHKGENLTAQESQENRRVVQKAWRAHFNNVTHSLINGFYQSWDLHPAQFAARYAAVYAFFLESKDAQSKRLTSFLVKATQAATTGNQFDDAASAQGILNFFLQALSCGAMTEREVSEATNLNIDELRSISFARILEKRVNGKWKAKNGKF